MDYALQGSEVRSKMSCGLTKVVLVEGSNLWHLLENFVENPARDVDYSKLLKWVAKDYDCDLLEARWYTALYPESPMSRFVDSLERDGWKLVIKEITLEDLQRTYGTPESVGNMDQWIIEDLIELATDGHRETGKRVDIVTLISGDHCFREAFEYYLRRRRVHTQLIGSTKRGLSGGTMSNKLYVAADEFYDIEFVLPYILRGKQSVSHANA